MTALVDMLDKEVLKSDLALLLFLQFTDLAML